VDGQNGVPAIQRELEMRAFLRSERDTLFRQPPLELGALHSSIVHIFVYYRNGPKEPRAEWDSIVSLRKTSNAHA
jgi:hypothetical protein